MGIYIDNVKLPKNCIECFFSQECEYGKKMTFPGLKKEDIIYYIGYRNKDCPMKEIDLSNIQKDTAK